MRKNFYLFIVAIFLTLVSCKSIDDNVLNKKIDMIKGDDYLFAAFSEQTVFSDLNPGLKKIPEFSFLPDYFLLKIDNILYLKKYDESIITMNDISNYKYEKKVSVGNTREFYEYIINSEFLLKNIEEIYYDTECFSLSVILKNSLVFNYNIKEGEFELNVPESDSENFIKNLENGKIEYIESLNTDFDKNMALMSIYMLDNSKEGIQRTALFYKNTIFNGVSEHNIKWIH